MSESSIADRLSTINTKLTGILSNANTQLTDKGKSTVSDISEIPTAMSELKNPTGTINITENGTVDVTNYAEASVDVQGGSSEYNAKINPVLDGTQSGSTVVYKSIEELPQLDATGVTDLYYLCRNFIKLKKINGGIINTGNALSIGGMFSGCKSLTDAPVMLDVTKAESMASMFDGCTSLVNVPVYNIPRVGTNSGAMSVAFRNCPNLSNESLNNILATCISATRMSSGKALETLGLSSEQIEVCKTLSNYQAFLDAGWTPTL